MNILEGRRAIEKRDSKFNGELTVIRDIFYGTYIQGGSLPQSGGLAETIWRNTLNIIKDHDIKNILILGLGGGGIAKLARKNWPESKITGIDIDPVIVDLGKKYLKLNNQNVNIIIADVSEALQEAKYKIRNTKYDLVCVDTYQGDQFPKEFATEKFTKKVKGCLSKNGIAIFNRLYGPEDRKLANDHEKILEKVFASVERNYPEANVMFIAR